MKSHGISTIAAILLLAGFALPFSSCSKANGGTKGASYVTGTISRGSIEKTVSSSGTLEPMAEVSVLAQMSGIVEKVNTDYNAHVTKGQILVELNTDMLKLERLEKVAAYNKAKATYDLQELQYQNNLKLADKNLISDFALKSSKATLDADAADLSSAQMALSVIDTEINQYAYIKSPIDGIVLAKNVDVGQSVVEGSSSNSSSIFTLAKDLSKMEIEATVDELDIAAIKLKQKVRFTVEALPKQEFDGTVSQIRLVPETTNNVVSYYVIIQADNKNGKLLPGMTAEIEFIEESKTNVLLVPSQALRYQPSKLSSAEIARKVFIAGLPPDMTASDKSKLIAAYDKQVKEASSESAKSKQASGLAGMVMGGGAGGPPGGGGPGGPGGGRGGKSSSSQKKSSATAAADTAAQSASGMPEGTPPSDASSGAPGAAPQDGKTPPTMAERKSIWYLDDAGNLDVILVEVGVSDGTNTEIVSQTDLEGKQVILKEKVK
jgi:HlyD family secretion protein